ncbi:GyrI-like domain-containing protein [Bacillus infantis]|uniref:GyrI-like domain-containing protein n=2 Tax=Bacillus infantis TaxID=324767 RepID=A0A5D4RLW2_9BACI|nr:GyrI-like domain-containing protein [Bacillus infantis]
MPALLVEIRCEKKGDGRMQANLKHKKRIVEMEEVYLIGFRVLCEGSQYIDEIPLAAKRLKERVSEIQGVKDSGRQIGAFVVNPASEDADGYWVGVAADRNNPVPEGMTSLTVPLQRYAAIHHHGPNTDIRKSYEILHRWIEAEGYERANDRWNLEIYDFNSDPDNTDHVNVELLDSIK